MDSIGTSNQRLLEWTAERRRLYLDKPVVFFPWRQPCTVKVLLVTDGGLDFGLGDFGLSAFVDVLLHDDRSYVDLEVTTAHLRASVSDGQVMQGAPGIARSIKGFAFDEPSHFTATMYDEVWMFGIESSFHFVNSLGQASYPNRQGNPGRYPAGALGAQELQNLSQHMRRGGGVFATGDHGSLGLAMCGSVDRVRSMRHWQDFGGGQVGMSSALRNDSNTSGHDPGSQFSDQSDDVPQRLDLRLYSTYAGFLREARYPHPVLCGRTGRVDVLPDHPHEGECREPASLTGTGSDGLPEYPPATDGSPRPRPEVIAWGHVPAGNTAAQRNGAFLKSPTQAHRFGVLSAYDGHRSGVGRVVCDATWHHFVNVNLIGVVEGGGFDDFDDPPGTGTPGTHVSKHTGFLGSAPGRAALDKIKDYYVNVAVWIAPQERVACMNSRFWWELVWSDRLVEATLLDPQVTLAQVELQDLFHIGVHARDVLGRQAGACQTIQWLLRWYEEIWVELIPHIDPWWPADKRKGQPPLPWVDLQPLVDLAIGGAVLAVRQAFPYPEELGDVAELGDKAVAIAQRGANDTLSRALDQMGADLEDTRTLLAAGRRRVEERQRDS